MTDNYVTYSELKNIGVLMDFFNAYKARDTWYIGVDIKVYDQNGEILGTITMTDGGEYGFYPECE